MRFLRSSLALPATRCRRKALTMLVRVVGTSLPLSLRFAFSASSFASSTAAMKFNGLPVIFATSTCAPSFASPHLESMPPPVVAIAAPPPPNFASSGFCVMVPLFAPGPRSSLSKVGLRPDRRSSAAPPRPKLGAWSRASLRARLACSVAHNLSRITPFKAPLAMPPPPIFLEMSDITWCVVTSSSSTFSVAAATTVCHLRVMFCQPSSRFTKRLTFSSPSLISRTLCMKSSTSACSSSSSLSPLNCWILCSQMESVTFLISAFDGCSSPKYPSRWASSSASWSTSVTSSSV
mmetsp:Transcript_29548/g.73168  ORF Transcript_29548/g.73168 Transcript_29548/m.73168 type:complete len:292 (+) Transcript_29548:678-1553(+)